MVKELVVLKVNLIGGDNEQVELLVPPLGLKTLIQRVRRTLIVLLEKKVNQEVLSLAELGQEDGVNQ